MEAGQTRNTVGFLSGGTLPPPSSCPAVIELIDFDQKDAQNGTLDDVVSASLRVNLSLRREHQVQCRNTKRMVLCCSTLEKDQGAKRLPGDCLFNVTANVSKGAYTHSHFHFRLYKLLRACVFRFLRVFRVSGQKSKSV